MARGGGGGTMGGAQNLGQLLLSVDFDASKAEAELDRMYNLTRKVGDASEQNLNRGARGARAMGTSFQNLGFQIQDVVVGLQAGQKPMTVFIQQGSQIAQIAAQMAGALGPQAAIYAAIAAAVAAAAGGLIAYVQSSNEATDAASALKQINEALETVFSDSKDDIEALAEAYAKLSASQLAVEEASARAGQVDLESTISGQEEAAEQAVEQLELLLKGYTEILRIGGLPIVIQGAPNLGPQIEAELQNLIDTYRETGLVTDELVTKAINLQASLGEDAPAAVRNFAASLTDALTTINKTVGAIEQLDIKARAAAESAISIEAFGGAGPSQFVPASVEEARERAAREAEAARKSAASAAKSDADRRANAIRNAQFALAEVNAESIQLEAELEAIKALGLPFDQQEREKLLSTNDGLRAQFEELRNLKVAAAEAELAAKVMEKIEGAVGKAQIAMSELQATTLDQKVALEVLQTTGFTSQAALDEATAQNDILREQVTLLEKVTRARLQAIEAERAERVIERERFQLAEQQQKPAPGFQPFGFGAPARLPVGPRAEQEAASQLGLPFLEGEREQLLGSNEALRERFALLTSLNAQAITLSERQADLEKMTEAAGAFAETLSRGLSQALFTGDWEGFAQSIIQNLIQMAIQAALTAAIMAAVAPFQAPAQTAAATSTLGFLTALIGGGGLSRQHGGHVRAGQRYFVGETGPEMFVPSTSGTIVPNRALGNNFSTTIDARGAQAGVGAEINRALSAFEKRLPGMMDERDRRGLGRRRR